MTEQSFREKFEAALQGQREESIQVFLRDHPGILLYTFCNAVGTYICLPKFRFGTEHVSDFIAVQLWSTITRITLIELEPSNENIFTANGRFAKRLNGAIAQVNDWFVWLKENDQYFCDSVIRAVTEANSSLAIPISNRIRHKSIQAKIIIGRRSSMSEQDKQRLAAQNLRDRDMEILAYDRLVDVASDMRLEGSERIIQAVSQRIVDSA